MRKTDDQSFCIFPQNFANMTKYFLIVLALISFVSVDAQDANFSQFYIASSYYNPAFAGAFDGKYRYLTKKMRMQYQVDYRLVYLKED